MRVSKRLVSVFLAFVMLIVALPLSTVKTHAVTSGDFEYEIISEDDKTAEIVSYLGSASNVVIPSVIDGYTVISLGDTVFGEDPNTFINTLTIPSSVQSISPMSIAFLFACSAFIVDGGNENYSSVDGILYNYDKTELVRFPCVSDSVTYTVLDSTVSLGFASFAYCGLKEVVLPNELETITDFSFSYSPELEHIVIPNSVTYIGEYSFYSCESLKTVSLSDSLSVINAYTFSECLSLTEAIIPESVESIEVGAFENTALSVVFCEPGSYADTFADNNGYITIDINASRVSGDMNNDFLCNDNDLDVMLQISVGSAEPSFMQNRLGDVNGDGVIDGFDIAQIDREMNAGN